MHRPEGHLIRTERLGVASALAAILVLAAWLRWTSPAMVEDLRPRPDALEYEEGARSLLRGDGYVLVIEGERFPPRYPIGFSALLVPALAVLGDAPGTGIWTVMVSALVAIGATAAMGYLVGGGPTAIGAALLIALSPLHVRWSRAVMSDVPATAVVAVLGWWTLREWACGIRSVTWLALGATAALGTSVRPAVASVLPAMALLVVARPGRREERLRAAAAFFSGAAIGFMPSLAFDWWRFGSFLRSSYSYWVPGEYFGWRFVLGPVFGGFTPNLTFYLGELAGVGRLHPWPVAILALVGTALLVRRPGPSRAMAILMLGTVTTLLGLQVPFFWQWDRYLLPALPLIAAAAAAPLATWAPRPVRAGALALLVLTTVAIARQDDPFAPPDHPLGDAANLRDLAGRTERNAAIVVRTNPFFFDRYLRRDADRLWVPLGRDEHRFIVAMRGLTPLAGSTGPAPWIVDALDRPAEADAIAATLRGLLAAGRPVYLSTHMGFQVPFWSSVARDLERRGFRLVPRGDTLYRLEQAAAG